MEQVLESSQAEQGRAGQAEARRGGTTTPKKIGEEFRSWMPRLSRYRSRSARGRQIAATQPDSQAKSQGGGGGLGEEAHAGKA